MKNFVQYVNKIAIASVGVLLAACGGGSCNNGGGGSASFDVTKLQISSPSQYPTLTTANTLPVIITNPTNESAMNLNFILNDKSGNNLSLSAGTCGGLTGVTLSESSSCTLNVVIPANAKPGSFSVIVQSGKTTSNGTVAQFMPQDASNNTVTNNIGITKIPTLSGDKTMAIYAMPQPPISINTNGDYYQLVTFVVNTESNLSAFNTITPVTSNGKPLVFTQISANSGPGYPALANGSVISMAIMIPAGSSSQPVYIGTANCPTTGACTDSSGVSTEMLNLQVYRPNSPGVANITIMPSLSALSANNTAPTSQLLTIVNTGNLATSSAVGLTEQGGHLKLSDNTCTSILQPNGSCSVVVSLNDNVATMITSGSDVISAQSGNLSSTADISYIGKKAVAGLSISGGSGNFVGTTESDPQEQIYTVTNTGNTSESNLTFVVSSSASAYVSIDQNAVNIGPNVCSSVKTLAPGGTCKIGLKVVGIGKSPTDGVQPFLIGVSYNFTTDDGVSQQTFTNQSFYSGTYNITQAKGVIVVSPTSINSGAIYGNNIESVSTKLTVTNQGNGTVSNFTASGLTNEYTMTNGCSGTIAIGGSCTIEVKFGPESYSEASAKTVNQTLAVGYDEYSGHSSTGITIPATGIVTSQALPTISVSLVGANGWSNDLSSITTNSVAHIAQNSALPTLTYKITGTGSGYTNKFYIDTSTLSNGWSVVDTGDSCPTAAGDAQLFNVGSTCNLTVQLRSTATVGAAAAVLTNLGQSRMTTNEPNSAGSIVQVNIPTTTITADVYGKPIVNVDSNNSSGVTFAGGSESFTVNITGGYNNPAIDVILTKSVVAGKINPPSTIGCTIAANGSSCNVTINLVGNESAGVYTYNLSAGNGAYTVGIYNSFTLIIVKALFVSNTSPQGDMNPSGTYSQATGVARADAICTTDAKNPDWVPKSLATATANGNTTWKAMLVDGTNRVATTTGTDATGQTDWVFLAQTNYVDAKSNLLIGVTNRYGVFNYLEALTNPFGSGTGYPWSGLSGFTLFLWTGLNPSWTTSTNTCSAWSSSSSALYGQIGTPENSGTFYLDRNNWSGASASTCDINDGQVANASIRILCVQQ